MIHINPLEIRKPLKTTSVDEGASIGIRQKLVLVLLGEVDDAIFWFWSEITLHSNRWLTLWVKR